MNNRVNSIIKEHLGVLYGPICPNCKGIDVEPCKDDNFIFSANWYECKNCKKFFLWTDLELKRENI